MNEVGHLISMMRPLILARRYAQDTNSEPWDFAVEYHHLREDLTTNDLRWLIAKGIVEHRIEVTGDSDERRTFQHRPAVRFDERSCFVLTSKGDSAISTNSSVAARRTLERCHLVPVWDRERGEFRLGTHLIKEFKLPSPNQEAILNAFEEEGWPPRIDDPLPPHPNIDPKRRLHDTIKSLNRNQRDPRLRFRGDGTGQGVRWDARNEISVLEMHPSTSDI